MPRNIGLTEAEWTLMEQLWAAPGLTDGKIYEVLGVDPMIGWLRVVDDSGEDYLYSPKHPRPIANPNHPGGRFEIIEDDENGTLRKAIFGKSMDGKGSPLRWGAFFNLFGYIGGRDAEQ